MRKLWSVLGNSQRLDGGAMFGNAPKAVWARWMAPDDRNRIELACRAMLIEETGDDAPNGRLRRVLVETGIGAFFSPEMRERYGVIEPSHVLVSELARLGLSDTDIDVVVLSHLHFDHAGGLLDAWAPNRPPRLLFSRATYVVGADAWHRARNPHPRDRASFIPELVELLAASGRLEVVAETLSEALGAAYTFHRSDGHTPGQLHLQVPSSVGEPIVFAGDLVPGISWMHVPITMGYDRFPERLIEEKAALLEVLAAARGRLFFTHDPAVAMARVGREESGRYVPIETWASVQGQPV